MRRAITFDWSNNAWTADQLTDRKTDYACNAVYKLQPLCVSLWREVEADLSLCHMARRLSRSVPLLGVQQDLCRGQRSPEDANVPLRGDNAEVAIRELIDTNDNRTLQGSWQHWHFWRSLWGAVGMKLQEGSTLSNCWSCNVGPPTMNRLHCRDVVTTSAALYGEWRPWAVGV